MNKTKRIDPVTRRVLLTGESIRCDKDGKVTGYEFKYTDKLTHQRKSIFAKSLTELREREKEVMTNIAKGLDVDKRKLTLNDVFDEWVTVIALTIKGNTLNNYKYMYNHYCRESIGRRKVADVTKSEILLFFNKLFDSYNLRINTIDTINNVLTQLFDKAIDDDMIVKTPMHKSFRDFKKAHRLIENNRKIKGLTREELALFEKYLSDSEQYNYWYPIFMLTVYLGLRCGELCALQVSDFDLEKMTVTINKTLVYYKGDAENARFVVNSTKTKSSCRTLPINEVIKDLVLKQIEYNKKNKLVCTSSIDGYNDFLFLNRFGSPYMNSTLNKALKRIVRDCNLKQLEEGKELLLPNISMHKFRHTFSNLYYESGVSLKGQTELLGHSSIQISQDIYTDLTIENLRTEMNRIFS